VTNTIAFDARMNLRSVRTKTRSQGGQNGERIALIASIVLWSTSTRAQVTGSFDGQVAGPRVAVPLNAAATLMQAGAFVTGTLALAAVPADFAGIYTLTGKATTKRLKVSGVSATGALLKWRAKIAPGVLAGGAKVKTSAGRLKGTLTLTLNVSTGDGSSCDGVYAGNSTLFVGQVMGQALAACTACHVAGGQADATRFHVVSGDPLATARSVALLVDSANPDASRILEKPLDLVPHGGGPQITAGSAEDGILRQWVNLIAQAHCS
jgi:hypothetical protein